MFTTFLVAALLSSDGGTIRMDSVTITKTPPCKITQTICFSPRGKCDEKLVALINEAKTSLEVAIYALNLPNVVDAILNAHKNGVAVRVILDSTQLGQAKEVIQVQRLVDAQVPMKRDGHSGIMHMKMVVVDDTSFEMGSFNFTNGGANLNNETMLIWSCPRNAILFKQEFDRMWANFLPVVKPDGGF